MYSKAKLMGRAVHPMLVSFPIVFYTAAFVCFCLFQGTENLFWYRVAFISNVAGVCAALIAAIPGAIDLFAGIPENTEPKKRGLLHAALNVTALVLYSINLYFIWGTFNAQVSPNIVNVFITAVGFGLTVVAGYQGHTLVAVDKVGVELTPEQERIERMPSMGQRVTT